MAMSANIVLLLVVSLAVQALSDTVIRANQTDDVHLEAIPSAILPGFTKHLSVNCTFLHDPTSDFTTLMSMTLFKVDDSAMDLGYKELSSITAVSRFNVTVKSSLGASVSGQLRANGETFIAYHWEYPDSQAVGTYKCEAYGMDATGHPRISSGLAEVTQTEACCPAFLQRFKEIEQLLEGQSVKLQKMQVLESRLDELQARMEQSRTATFEFSFMFKDHQYFLSRIVHWNTAVANSICRVHGGHLAHIDSLEEFNAVRDFLDKHSVTENIAIGGTDEEQEGTWKFLYSNSNVGYFNWRAGEPNGDYDCLFMGTWPGRQMHDWSCNKQFVKPNRYLCELSSQ